MTFSDSAVAIISTARFYTGTVAATKPTNYLIPGVAWTDLGHTSIDNVFACQSEGGEVTVLGTLQSELFQSTTTPRIDSFAITSVQLDLDTYKMYFGDNGTQDGTTKLFAVPNSPVPVSKAFLGVFTAGTKAFAIHADKAEIKRGDDLDFGEKNSIAGLPLLVTPLSYNGASSNWGITPLMPTGTAPFGA